MAHVHRHHGHHHGHDHSHAHGSVRTKEQAASQRKRLGIVLVLTAGFMVAEIVGGVISNSLALLADAGHMFTDAGAIALSLLAMRLALAPSSSVRTFGYVRLEILAALVNGAALLVISGLIAWEAFQRVGAPPEIDAPVMMLVAGGGLVVNIVAAYMLHAHADASLNIRGAYLHVLGDLLGSIGTLVAGGLILLFGWTLADPIISVVIALLILVSAWRLVREATEVLLEMAPRHVDMDAVLADLCEIDGLDDVHDIHCWTLTSGFVALSGHGVIDDPTQHQVVLDDVRGRLEKHGIGHITFQLEMRTLHQIGHESLRQKAPLGQ